MKRAAYGIDLGTTNSCIARFTGAGALTVIAIDGAPTVPSVVAFDGREWLCGRRAANHAMLEPHNAVRSIKRHMGEEHYRVRVCGEELSPVQVSAKILAYLKAQAEAAIGEAIREVVITVPAWFNEPQRRATVAAGEMAGLTVTRIVNEPTAAALAYRADGAGRAAEERWLVYDLGGGTFDCSILAVSGTCKEVLASCGNTFLGGDDFDHRIVLHLVDGIRDRHGIDPSADPLAMARLRHLAEQAKIRLSTEVEAPIHDHFEIGGRHLDLVSTLTRRAFNALIEDYLESTLAKARQALEEARITAANIERVLLVGGSTRIPRVHERVAQALGIEPEAYVDVDLSVALGAAAQSALDAGLSFAQVVVDIAPHALGVAALGDEDERSAAVLVARGLFDEDGPAEKAWDHHPLTFVPIIRKNTRLPARFVDEFYTTIDEQEVIEVAVYQGESRNTRDNIHVGAFFVPLPPMPAGSPVQIGFEYDRNGLIRVSVSEKGSALKRYTMDLNRSAAGNSEPALRRRPVTVDEGSEDGDGSAGDAAGILNFLIERVERRLAEGPEEAHPEVRELLSSYRQQLAAGDDERLDELEETLYAWLDAGGEEEEERLSTVE
ncbi:MAG: Hsp70 family protein [Gammaproteobacteria bacterium]